MGLVFFIWVGVGEIILEKNNLKNKISWKWDKWQSEVLAHEGNVTLRTGRQVGKSTVIAEKAVRFACDNDGVVVMIIAASERQSSLLFEKVRSTIDLREDEFKEKYFAEPATLSKAVLTNGSVIHSVPAGRTGAFIRGYTVDLLIADEAAFISEVVWSSVLPMVAVSRKVRGFGWLFLLSTPFGKGGYYYNTFTDPSFKSWHVNSEFCPRIDRAFLAGEKKRMTKVQYQQEYLGEFCEEWNQLFKTELIKRQMTFIEWSLSMDKLQGAKYFLGVDVARYGGDENAFVICEMVGFSKRERLKIVRCDTTDNVSTVDTIGRIVELDKMFDFKKIFIDDAGVGGAVTDVLEQKLGRKVMGINNASKRLEVQGEEKKKGILKEDLYSNALMLMEQDKIDIISNSALMRSLKSITFEYGENGGKVRIFGAYSHLAEAFVRACWCIKERGLDIFLY